MKKLLWYKASDGTVHQIASHPKKGHGVGNRIGMLHRWAPAVQLYIVGRYKRALRTKQYNYLYVLQTLRQRRDAAREALRQD